MATTTADRYIVTSSDLFLDDLDEALADIRWAKEHGLAGIMSGVFERRGHRPRRRQPDDTLR